MKRIFFSIFFFVLAALALSNPVSAQSLSFVGFGAGFTHSSNVDDGRANFGGAYVEGGARLPLDLEMRLLAEYNHNATLPAIFTMKAGGSRSSIGEFRLRPELRFNFSREGRMRFFVFAAGDYYRQRFYVIEAPYLPGPVPAYVEEPGERLPVSGINPVVGAGLRLGKSGEASFGRIFADTTALNASGLEGIRGAASFSKSLSEQWDFKVGVELDRVSLREAAGFDPEAAAPNRETYYVAKFRLGFVLKKNNK